MAIGTSAPLPVGIPFVDDGKPFSQTPPLFLTPDAVQLFQNLQTQIASAPQQARSALVLANQSASIGVTALQAQAYGRYRASWNGIIKTAAGVSSSLQVAIVWTQNAQTLTWTGTAQTGNTVASYTSEVVPLIVADSGSVISYTVTYASNPAAAMVYELSVVLEALS